MSVRDWLTRHNSAKQDLELFTNSEWQRDQMKVVAQTLNNQAFTLILESLKHQLKRQWEKEKSAEGRERLHCELQGINSLEKRIRGLISEIER